MTIQKLARKAASAFTTKQRGDESIVVCVDKAADWIGEMCQAAHGDMLPDDFRYRLIQDAVEAIAEADEDADLDDLAHEFADSVDVYTSDLYRWLSSHMARGSYVDEAVAEFGHGNSLADDLMRGQYQERQEVFVLVLQALRQQAEE